MDTFVRVILSLLGRFRVRLSVPLMPTPSNTNASTWMRRHVRRAVAIDTARTRKKHHEIARRREQRPGGYCKTPIPEKLIKSYEKKRVPLCVPVTTTNKHAGQLETYMARTLHTRRGPARPQHIIGDARQDYRNSAIEKAHSF